MRLVSVTPPEQDPRSAFNYRELRGEEVLPFLADLGRLRIDVFREFPYLYEGDLAYERDYLRVYANSPPSLVVLLLAGSEIVGATTCPPVTA